MTIFKTFCKTKSHGIKACQKPMILLNIVILSRTFCKKDTYLWLAQKGTTKKRRLPEVSVVDFKQMTLPNELEISLQRHVVLELNPWIASQNLKSVDARQLYINCAITSTQYPRDFVDEQDWKRSEGCGDLLITFSGKSRYFIFSALSLLFSGTRFYWQLALLKIS